MVRSCAASGCTNRDTKESRTKGIAFYQIPLKKDKRLKWLNALKRKDYNPSSSAAICSTHFVGGKLPLMCMHAYGCNALIIMYRPIARDVTNFRVTSCRPCWRTGWRTSKYG